MPIRASEALVRRQLHKAGLSSQRAAKLPFLTHCQRVAKRAFAFGLEKGVSVIFMHVSIMVLIVPFNVSGGVQ